MDVRLHHSLEDIPADDWNRLAGDVYPFTRHEFLVALERHDCVGEKYGWFPMHLAAYDQNELVGALPLYLKDNSYGELVFDWGWADAYHRAGLAYYPKLVSAIPYTPATGPRLLLHPVRNDTNTIAQALIAKAIALAQERQLSSLHVLFTTEQDSRQLTDAGLLLRMGCQFHWHNHDYQNFNDYLATFTAEKRKKIKRERRRVEEQAITLEVLHGEELNDAQWNIFHQMYCSTFDRKSGMATLSLPFFKEISRTMPGQVVIVMARHDNDYVAVAYNVRGKDTLYGRHWGCTAEYHSLHFEACYYQGLDYCIQHGLAHFEPGAQGEHKVSRGFEPTTIWSTHWIAHPQFKQAIAQFVQQEQRGVQHYMETLDEHLPFKHPDISLP